MGLTPSNTLATAIPAQYALYLDNLFTNTLLANALAELGIGVMDTTRVNALGYPLSLIQLKKSY